MTLDPNLVALASARNIGTLATIKRDGRPVLEGLVELSGVAAAPDDDTVDELVEVCRAIRGADHPDWDEYRAATVADRRLVASLPIDHAYGLAGTQWPGPL
jgi:hypothetical protein